MFGDMPDEVMDSYERYWNGEDSYYEDSSNRVHRVNYGFTPDSTYYHTYIRNAKLEAETEKAFLFQDKRGKFWFPKRYIKKQTVSNGSFSGYLWTKLYKNRAYI